jgi:hypothetical protein
MLVRHTVIGTYTKNQNNSDFSAIYIQQILFRFFPQLRLYSGGNSRLFSVLGTVRIATFYFITSIWNTARLTGTENWRYNVWFILLKCVLEIRDSVVG